jgi:tRNA 5-methylaminomethyl-2-thiouridine biosynthesis bifunctional protein
VLLGDARAATWPTGVDAVYLDGFSPSVNPELWTDEVLARVASHLAAGGAVASYCVQGRVRRALEGAGLRVEKRPGPPGGKREVLWARRPSQPPAIDGPPLDPARPLAGTRVAIVGAGVAGRSLAWAATRAGATVAVFDATDGHGGASGVPAALVNPYRGRAGRATDDDLHGAERTWAWAAHLAGAGLDPGAHPTGVVRLADGSRQARAWSARAGVLPFGPEADPAPGRWRAPHGGIVVPKGGWIDPARWLAALRSATAAHGGRDRPATPVTGLTPATGGGWRLHVESAAAGVGEDTFDLVALCLGASAPGALPHLPVTAVPGTVALVAGHLPARPLAGAVYAAPVGSPARHGLEPLASVVRRRRWPHRTR